MWRSLLLLFLILSSNVQAAITFPVLTGRVVDEAKVIDLQTKTELEQQLAAFEQSSGNQIVVVTLRGLQQRPIEEYGYQLGRHWGIGQKDKDNGALLIIVPSERQTRIEVGYGLEGELTDAISRIIIEERMIPHFRSGHYAEGIRAGVSAILATLGDQSSGTPVQVQPEPEDESIWQLLIPFLVLFLILRGSGRRRSGLLTPLILGSILSSGGGGSRSGGFGGVGFRGGGGSFGGGGASGRW